MSRTLGSAAKLTPKKSVRLAYWIHSCANEGPARNRIDAAVMTEIRRMFYPPLRGRSPLREGDTNYSRFLGNIGESACHSRRLPGSLLERLQLRLSTFRNWIAVGVQEHRHRVVPPHHADQIHHPSLTESILGGVKRG